MTMWRTILAALLILWPASSFGQVAVPQLAAWQANMLTFGQAACDFFTQPHTSDELLNQTYYDAERVFYQIADYTGNAAWATCVQRAKAIYRDKYVVPNAGKVPGYWNFTHGLAMDFLRTGDAASKNAAILLSQNAAYAADGTELAWTVSPERSREVAYAIMSYLNAEKVGAPRRARLPQLVDQALGHLDQWFVSKTYRCPSDCDPPSAVGQYYIQPFMVGLTAEALILYFDKTQDARILPALKTALDWLWANAWVASAQAFWYDNAVANPSVPWPARPGAPDLNLLIAPAYAWVYRQTGDPTYRDRGDQVFAGGVVGAFLGGGKQFDQNYKWSFDYVKWRAAGTPPPPPPPPSTVAVLLTAGGQGPYAGGVGVTVPLTATVTGVATGDGIAKVEFVLGTEPPMAIVTTPPYQMAWSLDPKWTPPGSYALSARATTTAGATATSPVVIVQVVAPTSCPVCPSVPPLCTLPLSASPFPCVLR